MNAAGFADLLRWNTIVRDWKVTQKGLLLVSVPLCFELVFIISLLYTIFQTDQELQHAARARKILEQVRRLDVSYSGTFVFLTRYTITLRDEDRELFNHSMADYAHEIKRLKPLAENSPSVGDLNLIYKYHSSIFKNAVQGRELIDLGLFKDASPLLLRNRELIGELQEIVLRFLEQNSLVAVRSPELIRQGALQLETTLIAAMCVSLVASVFLALFFSRSISNRILLVYENARLFTAGKSLREPLDGRDEIAILDKRFHSMMKTVSESRRKERAAIDSASEVICSLDKELRLTAWNDSAGKLFQHSGETLSGMPVLDFMLESERSGAQRVFKELKEKGGCLSFETKLNLPGAQGDDYLWSALWSENENSYFLVVRNISEAKQLERQRAEFVSMVSHDLRSPLTSMTLGLQALSGGYVGSLLDHEDGLAIVKESEEDAQSLLKLVNDLLQVEKMESGKAQVELAELDLNKLIEQVAKENKEKLARRRMSLRIACPEDGKVNADFDGIAQVLNNLLDNAMRYSHESDEIVIEVRDLTEHFEVCVTDHGPGLPEYLQKSVFDRFRDVGAGGSNKAIGLGLPMCKQIIDAHGGEIAVTCKEGLTAVSFRLPRINDLKD